MDVQKYQTDNFLVEKSTSEVFAPECFDCFDEIEEIVTAAGQGTIVCCF